MFHAADGLRLTPAYDPVAAALCPQFQTLALRIGKATDLAVSDIKPRHLVGLGRAHGLDAPIILDVARKLETRRGAAEKAILAAARLSCWAPPGLKTMWVVLAERGAASSGGPAVTA